MDYIYDIVLNFQNEYYDFYEWQPSDKIINVKRLPIYKIKNIDYLNIKNNKVTIERNTLPKQNKLFLITSGIEVMGILIDNNGRVIKKSSLIFEESDDILTDIDEIKLINIKYKIDAQEPINLASRISKEKSTYIEKYLHKLDKVKDEYFLKYLYYDIYNIEEDDINIIYNKLVELSKNDVFKMYDSIIKINLELKKG